MTSKNSTVVDNATVSGDNGEQEATVSIVTPYAAAKSVNATLTEAGVTRQIAPQMMYNYTKARLNAGKSPLIAYTLEGGVDVEALQVWTEAYVVKQLAKQNVVVDEG